MHITEQYACPICGEGTSQRWEEDELGGRLLPRCVVKCWQCENLIVLEAPILPVAHRPLLQVEKQKDVGPEDGWKMGQEILDSMVARRAKEE